LDTTTRAHALCQQVGEPYQLFPVLRGLCLFYLNRGELITAHELGEQLVRVAQCVQDSALLLEAHNVLGATLAFQGEFAAAREHLEQSLALYDALQHHSLAFRYGFDPRVFCLGRVAQSLWSLGYPDKALQRSQEALTRAQELSYPSSLALALMSAAFLHQFRQEERVVQGLVHTMITLSGGRGLCTIWGWELSCGAGR
jgi:predicted ATPase